VIQQLIVVYWQRSSMAISGTVWSLAWELHSMLCRQCEVGEKFLRAGCSCLGLSGIV